jgi:hypothetical protein
MNSYLINVMDSVVSKPYVIVYYHTDVTSEKQPDSSVFKQLFSVGDSRYSDNLYAMYMIHPTFWAKAFTWWVTSFLERKVVSLFNNVNFC